MDSQWAVDNLQTIRTLMERSALYRRALAPVMIIVGAIGLAGASLPCSVVAINTNAAFSLYWSCVSLVAFTAAVLLVRRQALKEAEPFWSPPTRRVTQALLPAFLVGLILGLLFLLFGSRLPQTTSLLALAWTVIYGFALHAAGFFMQRGIKFFGWLFVLGGSTLLCVCLLSPNLQTTLVAHAIMGTFFGLLHLSYGIYLYFTERTRNTA